MQDIELESGGSHEGRGVSLQTNYPISYVTPEALKQPKRNVRRHPPEQLAALARSIEQYGFMVPVLIDGSGAIVCGVARVEAAKQAGLREIPAIEVTHLSKAQIRAYRLADNKLAEAATWDLEELKLEFEEIALLEPGFELTDTGFHMAELDIILDGDAQSDAADLDGIAPEQEAVARVGDLWLMGKHKLLCGDAKADAAYARLLDGDEPRLLVTDPPYGIAVRKISGKGRTSHPEFVEGSDDMPIAAFLEFSKAFLRAATSVLPKGSLIYAWIDWRNVASLIEAGRSLGLELVNIACWNKGTGGMGSFYRSQHELCVIFKKPGASHRNNVQLGRHGRYRTNVWSIPGLNSFGRGRDEQLAAHPTAKPISLIADIIKDASHRGELIVDCFCGSGTTLIAAEKTGREARCIELDPRYVDVAIRRFERRFGIEAVHAQTGMSFAEVRSIRKKEKETSPKDEQHAAGQAPGSGQIRRPVRRPPPAGVAENRNVVGRGRKS